MTTYDPHLCITDPDPKKAIIADLQYHGTHILTAMFDTDQTPDIETVQFTYKRAIPHRQLHTIRYKNVIGEHHQMTYQVLQNTENNWYATGSIGQRLDDPELIASKDHLAKMNSLQVNLSGGGTPFWACGNVIDNEAQATKVALKSANGNHIEDVVQEKFVLFLTNQEMLFPMEVELYNHSGDIVHRQVWGE